MGARRADDCHGDPDGCCPGHFPATDGAMVTRLIERVTANQPVRVRLDDRSTVNPEQRTQNNGTQNDEPRTPPMSDYAAIIPIVIVVLAAAPP